MASSTYPLSVCLPRRSCFIQIRTLSGTRGESMCFCVPLLALKTAWAFHKTRLGRALAQCSAVHMLSYDERILRPVLSFLILAMRTSEGVSYTPCGWFLYWSCTAMFFACGILCSLDTRIASVRGLADYPTRKHEKKARKGPGGGG